MYDKSSQELILLNENKLIFQEITKNEERDTYLRMLLVVYKL